MFVWVNNLIVKLTNVGHKIVQRHQCYKVLQLKRLCENGKVNNVEIHGTTWGPV